MHADVIVPTFASAFAHSIVVSSREKNHESTKDHESWQLAK